MRELENVLGNACMMVTGSVIDMRDLPEYLSDSSDSAQQDGLLSLEKVQRRHVLYVLEQVGNNKARAAEVLDISRTTLYNFLAKSESEVKHLVP